MSNNFTKAMAAFLFALPFTLTAQTYNHYFGNIHAHTAFSDGSKDKKSASPTECYTYAKKSKHFDFLGISEHNHSQAGMFWENYRTGLREANDANEDGEFVCMYGIEYGVIKNGGHVLVYGIDSLTGWEDENHEIFCGKFDYRALWKLIAERPTAFATLAHPAENDFKNLLKGTYNKTADAAICGMAIRTGPAFSTKTNYSEKPSGTFYSYYTGMLAAGYKLGPGIDHDTHNTVFGRSHQSRTVVLAEELSRDSIMAAYRAMRFYASDDWNAKVDFTINGAPMGSTIGTDGEASISVTVNDEDQADKVTSIKLLFGKPGSGRAGTVLISNSNKKTLTFTHSLRSRESFYYHLVILQKDGDRIYTAPIWVVRD